MSIFMFISIMTLILLLISFLLIFSKLYRKTATRLSLLILLFGAVSFPLFSVMYQVRTTNYLIDFSTIGTVFFLTWTLVVFTLLGGIFFRFRVNISEESEMYRH
ncbi:hypothetical protein [Cytobacillus kochii]|uniref:hypothetical protein n=1 Tax=Cytobacillus kochii TaxID=859143 RepID=UPI00203E493B|nr:hypothetical protein [Cytobacillus kochii]MCM3322561.1 hypothetical protein [Cytobacillus kochii]MCM3344960.1 hypothetical protein [Cytobacillus kochii]